MLTDFHLLAITREQGETVLYRVPLTKNLQESLTKSWDTQLTEFTSGIDRIEFNAGYKPEDEERFEINGYSLPDAFAGPIGDGGGNLDPIDAIDGGLEQIRGLAGVAKHDGVSVVLFQNFSRSQVIKPATVLFRQRGVYTGSSQPSIALSNSLGAVDYPEDETLLFKSFRTTNTFLPLMDYYEAATEADIRETLSHDLLAPEDIDALAVGANQWMRKRFALLAGSGILDNYSASEIKRHSRGFRVNVRVKGDKIVFPSDKAEAKRLLQYLNEELFRGAITDRLYETNSKRASGDTAP